MAKKFTIEVDEEFYRLVGPGGEEGDVVEYGEIAQVEVGSEIFEALVEDPDDAGVPVFKLVLEDEMPAVEEAEFEFEGDEDDEDEEVPA